ncbi:unnamed protein product [Caretta caretta]
MKGVFRREELALGREHKEERAETLAEANLRRASKGRARSLDPIPKEPGNWGVDLRNWVESVLDNMSKDVGPTVKASSQGAQWKLDLGPQSILVPMVPRYMYHVTMSINICINRLTPEIMEALRQKNEQMGKTGIVPFRPNSDSAGSVEEKELQSGGSPLSKFNLQLPDVQM